MHGLWTQWERSCTNPPESGVSTFCCVLASFTSGLGEFWLPAFTCVQCLPHMRRSGCLHFSTLCSFISFQESISCKWLHKKNKRWKKKSRINRCVFGKAYYELNPNSCIREPARCVKVANQITCNTIDTCLLIEDVSVHLMRLLLLCGTT